MNPTRRVLAGGFGALALFLGCVAPAQAAWPERPVRIVVGAAAGSAPDILARLVSQALAPLWGQGVVIDNRPGAGGNVAAQAVARSVPDGYTLWFAHAAPVVVNPFLFKDPGFRAERDFAPIVRVGVGPMVIAVHPDLPVRSLKELVAWGRDGRRTLSYATSGAKNIPHLTGEYLNALTGLGMVNVPYKGSQQAIADTIGGRTEVYVDAVAPLAPFLGQEAGADRRLRPLAVTSATRLRGFETLPTAVESGVDLVVQGWLGYMAPAGVPEAVVQRVARDVDAVLKQPEIVARLAMLGIFEPGGTTAEFAAFLRSERALWARLVTQAGIERE